MRLIDADLVKPAMENSDDSLLNQPMTIRHVESLLDDLPTVQVVSLARVKQLREEIDKLADDSIIWGILANAEDSDIDAITERINECYRAMIFPLIDKLIAEAED